MFYITTKIPLFEGGGENGYIWDLMYVVSQFEVDTAP